MDKADPRRAAVHRQPTPSLSPRAPTHRTRVLHIVLDLEAGGLERFVADLVRRTDPERFAIHLLALQSLGRYAAGLERFAELHVAPPGRIGALLWPFDLRDRIRRIAPDVVHTHSGVWLKGARAARMARVQRIVHTDHGRSFPDPLPDRLQDRVAAQWTDVVVGVSDALTSHLRAAVVPRGTRVVTISNGVDTDEFRPCPDDGKLRAELGAGNDVPLIGSLGRFARIKGYDVMVEAFALLRARPPFGVPPLLVVAGDGEERAALEALVQARGIKDSVRFLAWRTDVASFHSALSIFSLSSRSEGTSISLLEAMSAAVCPVVTDVGGNAAVLGDGLRHRLVPSEDPQALAESWRRALEDPAARSADARAARQRVLETFSLQAAVRAYEDLYVAPEEAD